MKEMLGSLGETSTDKHADDDVKVVIIPPQPTEMTMIWMQMKENNSVDKVAGTYEVFDNRIEETAVSTVASEAGMSS